jgi:hypothetical protein
MEVPSFIDQAKYIRVYLPNRVYKNASDLSQSIILNPNQWQNERISKNLARFYNQTSLLLIVNENEGGNFELNPLIPHKKMYWD